MVVGKQMNTQRLCARCHLLFDAEDDRIVCDRCDGPSGVMVALMFAALLLLLALAEWWQPK